MDVAASRGEDGQTPVRRDPEEVLQPVDQTQTSTQAADSCPDCHALVSDLAAHKTWHSRLVSSIANAVTKESQRHPAAHG